MTTIEEHQAILFKLMRDDWEEIFAEVSSWLEEAEAKGWTAAARRHRESLAQLDAMNKPWE